MAFPAISAIKSRLVEEHEQGLLQGALSTGKSIAESLGPLVFSFLFTGMNGNMPALFIGALSLVLLAVHAALPRLLALHREPRLEEAEVELSRVRAESVSGLDDEQRQNLL